jgi:hypothetical protein
MLVNNVFIIIIKLLTKNIMNDKLFYFTRDYKTLVEYPYVVIVVWKGCPAWCDLCSFSRKVAKSECFDYEWTKELMNKINDIFFSKFEILFHWVNLLDHPYIDDIISYTKNDLNRWVRIQLEHSMKPIYYDKLKTLFTQYWKFSAIIRIDVKKQEDFRLFYDTFKKLIKVDWVKVYFEIFLDREKFMLTIDKIMWWRTTDSDNEFNCIIWNKFDIKFHNYIWKLNRSDEKIDNIEHRKCYMYDFFDVKNNKITINDHIEVQNNWDFIFHDDLCYIWQAKISNINKSNDEIYKDFIKYKYKYLESLRNNSEKSCYKCIMNKYHYNKGLKDYNF